MFQPFPQPTCMWLSLTGSSLASTLAFTPWSGARCPKLTTSASCHGPPNHQKPSLKGTSNSSLQAKPLSPTSSPTPLPPLSQSKSGSTSIKTSKMVRKSHSLVTPSHHSFAPLLRPFVLSNMHVCSAPTQVSPWESATLPKIPHSSSKSSPLTSPPSCTKRPRWPTNYQ